MSIRITLEQMVYGGATLGRHRGKAVFVHGGITGEEVEVEVVEEKKDFLTGRAVRVLRSSPHRINPPCPHFGLCGGCHWQHIDYPAQLHFKSEILAEQLRRIGGFEGVAILPVIPMDDPWRYRQKVRLGLRTGEENVSLGFYTEGTRSPIGLETCPVMDELIFKVYECLRNECSRSIQPFRGFCTVEIRSSGDDVQILANRSVSFRQSLAPLSNAAKRLPSVKGFHQQLLRKHLPPGYTTDYGDPLISYDIDGLTFHLQPTSFFQVNREQAEKMFVTAMTMMDLNGGRILDAYCGIGVLTLIAARRVDEAIGVEVTPSAVEDARENARSNGVANVRFDEGLFQDHLPRLAGGDWDGVILDPPREGVVGKKVLRQLAGMGPERILYISCNPATLARDCRRLCENGYTLRTVQPVDMFPQTYHIEAIALLERV